METFNFPVHHSQVSYPDGQTVQMGRGYGYGVKPILPVKRTFILNFEGMQWHLAENGLPEATTNPTLNMKALLDFYDRHQMWKRFIYPSQIYGNVTVRFAQKFETPKSHKGGSGWTESFELRLMEQGA